MKISEETIKFLGRAICGDSGLIPYKSGPQLVDFFASFGSEDIYENGFPSRWKYTENKIREYNTTDALNSIIELSIDPRVFLDSQLDLKEAIKKINEFLVFDGYELKKQGSFYKVFEISGIVVETHKVNTLNEDFIKEQIKKCNDKIEKGDYNGAITNARSLAEAVMIKIIEENQNEEIKNDGNIDNLYKKVKKILNIKFTSSETPQFVLQIISGLDSIVSGLAGLSNNFGDRHANKSIAKRHHARLAVNSSMTFVDFLLESKDFQKK